MVEVKSECMVEVVGIRSLFQALAADRLEPARPLTTAPAPDAQALRALFVHEYAALRQSLLHAVLHRHLEAVGLDWEDRAIEHMKHLGWVGEALAVSGQSLPWHVEGPQAHPDGPTMAQAWDALADRVASSQPGLAAHAHRSARHWAAHASLAKATERRWTVGPLGPFRLGPGFSSGDEGTSTT